MEKLINTKWQIAAAEDVKKTLEEIRELVISQGWEQRKVYPYSFPINIIDMIDSYKDYDNFTFMSKEIALSEINGLIEHAINPWLEYEKKPKVWVNLVNGEKIYTTEDIAKVLMESGKAISRGMIEKEG